MVLPRITSGERPVSPARTDYGSVLMLKGASDRLHRNRVAQVQPPNISPQTNLNSKNYILRQGEGFEKEFKRSRSLIASQRSNESAFNASGLSSAPSRLRSGQGKLQRPSSKSLPTDEAGGGFRKSDAASIMDPFSIGGWEEVSPNDISLGTTLVIGRGSFGVGRCLTHVCLRDLTD